MTDSENNIEDWLSFIQTKYNLKVPLAFSKAVKINHKNREAPNVIYSDFYMTDATVCHTLNKPISKIIKQ